MELIEVQHCHETVRLSNVQDFNSKVLFQRSMPLKMSTLFDEGENNAQYQCTISLNCEDVDVEFVRSKTS